MVSPLASPVNIKADDVDTKEKYPPYLYTLIENFCLGTRRLELFNDNPNAARRGWVTATTHLSPPTADNEMTQRFDPATYQSLLPKEEARPILPFHPEIDQLRPKSPPRRGATRGGHLPTNTHQQGRPPRHHQNQNQMPHHQLQTQAQAQAHAHQMQMQMQMQAQMHHMQMMAAMNMNMGTGMGMGMPDPMMMQGMGMGQGQDPGQGQGQGGWGYAGYMGNDGGMQSPQQGGYDQQAWQGGYEFDPQGGQGQWQGGQYPFQSQQGQGQGPGWGWQQ